MKKIAALPNRFTGRLTLPSPLYWLSNLKTANPLKGNYSIPNDAASILGGLFIFFSFFPYVRLSPVVFSDVQPNALLIAGILFLLTLPRRSPHAWTPFILLLLVTTAVFLLDGLQFDNIRNYLGYFSFALFPYVTFRVLQRMGKYPMRFIYYAVVIWTIVGMGQIVNEDFMTFVISRSGTTESRGVTSLAAEPTYYGIISAIFGIIIVVIDHPKKKQLLLMLLFGIVLLARSSMTLLFLVLLLGMYIVVYIHWKRLLALAVMGTAGVLAIWQSGVLEGSSIRIFRIISRLSTGGLMTLIRRDESVNDRAAHIYFPFKAFYEDGGIPHGFASFESYLAEALPKQELFWWVSESNRIMSTYGAAMFELGWFGLLIPITLTGLMFSSHPGEIRKPLVISLFLNMMLFTSIPISYPPLGFLMGILVYKTHVHNQRKKLT